jgi:hypothetical protein
MPVTEVTGLLVDAASACWLAASHLSIPTWIREKGMLPTPGELREQSRRFRDVAYKAATSDLKRRLATDALVLAQIAEAIEREGVVQGVKAERYRRLLAEVLGEEPRAMTAPGVRDRIMQWRMRAVALRTTADEFEVPSAQESLRRAAADYDRLADDAEAVLTGHPPVTDETVS